MEKTDFSKELELILADTDQMINQAKTYLISKGVEPGHLADWVTVEEYCQRFGINNIETVNSWINQGIVPARNIRRNKDLNNARLIKAVPYKATQIAGS